MFVTVTIEEYICDCSIIREAPAVSNNRYPSWFSFDFSFTLGIKRTNLEKSKAVNYFNRKQINECITVCVQYQLLHSKGSSFIKIINESVLKLGVLEK